MDTTKGSHTQADAAAEPGSAPLQGVEHVAASRLPTRQIRTALIATSSGAMSIDPQTL